MHRRIYTATFTACLVLFTVSAKAQTSAAKQMDAYCTAQASLYNFPGVVLVAKGKNILYQKAFGLANREWNIPNAIDTRFRIGSLSKQFAAAAILKLVEEGKLSLDDKLSKWYPDFPKADSVTVHRLLNHTSGIKNITSFSDLGYFGTAPLLRDSLIRKIAGAPYDFSPGSRFLYNNSGYVLLGDIITKLTGAPEGDYVQQKLLAPAGITTVFLDRHDTVLPRRASGYTFNGRQWINAPYYSLTQPGLGGALTATIADLHRWQIALHGGKLLRADSYQKMTTRSAENYGYALRMDTLYGRRCIWHSGSISGFTSYAAYYPDEDVHVILFSNRVDNRATIFMGQVLAGLWFNVPVPPAKKRVAQPLSVKRMEELEGRYETEYAAFRIKAEGGKLYAVTEGSQREWKQAAEDLLFLENGTDTQLKIYHNGDGSVQKLTLIRNGWESPLIKK